jgi:hypothetical protein
VANRKVEPTRFLNTGIYYLYQNARVSGPAPPTDCF